MEASLLPSKAIRALAKRVVLAVIRAMDPKCAELRKEFAVPYLNSWVVVLDGKGETLASWLGDSAGAGCNKRSVARFPRNLAALIRKSLEYPESVQEMERRWRREPSNIEAFDNFAGRLQQMHRYGKLREVCQKAATNPRLSQEQRNHFRLRAFLARAYDHKELSTRKARNQFIRDGEDLLVELAYHPTASEIPNALFSSVHAHGFDVPAKSAQAIARLEKRARQLDNPEPLKEHILSLARIREEWIQAMEKCLNKASDASTQKFIAASLGDADAAIEIFSQPGYSEIPQYRERLREAEMKKRRAGRAG